MNSLRAVIRAGSFALLVLVLSITARANEWQRGDVVVAIGKGQYQVWRQGIGGYTKIETLTDGSGTVSGENVTPGNGFTYGCAFDSTGHLYTTNFSNTKVYKFSIPDPHSVSQTIDTNAATPSGHSESLVFDGSGNFFVGNPDFHPMPGKAVVLKYSPAGTLLNTFTVDLEDRGADWLEMSSDGHTLFYTSEGSRILRFDASSNIQRPDYLSIPHDESGNQFAFSLKLLPPGDGTGGVLVADWDNVKRLDASGHVVTTYTGLSEENSWYGLSLDINGTSFWATDYYSGNMYRFNIETGAIEVGFLTTVPFNGESGAGVGGVCVNGVYSPAQPQPFVQTLTLVPPNNTGTVFNDNNSNSWQVTLDGLTETAHVTIAFTEIAQSAGNSDIPGYGPCELASADGTKCTVHQVSVDVPPTSYPGGIDFYHHWTFKPPTPINPRMIKNGFTDITTAVFLEPGTAGHTNDPSPYLDNEAPKTTGSSCGFLFPRNNSTWEAEFPLTFVFTAVANGKKCSRGPFLTNLKPVISLGLIGTGTITPITLSSTAFQDFHGLWYYTLPTSNLQPGTYVVSVFDQSNQIPAFSEQINIVPEN